MKNKISKSDFIFKFTGAGHYVVYYSSPVTYRRWSKLVTDMQLIDLTKNESQPKSKDLQQLKRLVKSI